MNKQEFLAALQAGLRGLPQEDIQHWVDFYREMVEDRMEDGMSEGEAVAALGSVRDVVAQILSETSLPKLVQAKVKPKHPLKAWEVVLLVLGSPVWVPLLLAGALLVLACYTVLWSIIITLYAIDLSFALGAVAGLIGFFQFVPSGDILPGLFLIGMGLMCAGLSILLFLTFGKVTSLLLHGSKRVVLAVKFRFIRKEENQ